MKDIILNFDSVSEETMSNYAGEWIAIIDAKVVAHGKSLKEVYEYVNENYPNKRPLLGKLPEASPTILSIS